jgi:2-polyprenyl-3-methyl-5-hydroxy-6-metoxy-1,4-benzoquinol methylase
MKVDYKIVLNEKYGFYQVSPSPTPKELDEYYNSNYYDNGTYAVSYSENELIQKLLPAHEISFLLNGKKGKVLDIGCGEGFVINQLLSEGWDVTGLDFSLDGVKRHFPHLADKVIQGDIYKSLEELINNKIKFDVIVCNNVLEHVIDPLTFLSRFKSLCHEETVIRIQVPNDFSWLQQAMKRDGMIKNEYWVSAPAHLSYFNNESLRLVLESFDYKIVDFLGDFPIELFLLNEKCSYNLNNYLGPFAHNSRLYFDVNLYRTSIEKFIAFRRGCGESGVCRNLIAYCKIKS